MLWTASQVVRKFSTTSVSNRRLLKLLTWKWINDACGSTVTWVGRVFEGARGVARSRWLEGKQDRVGSGFAGATLPRSIRRQPGSRPPCALTGPHYTVQDQGGVASATVSLGGLWTSCVSTVWSTQQPLLLEPRRRHRPWTMLRSQSVS